jgi:branched-chain amino acid aminotransferase
VTLPKYAFFEGKLVPYEEAKVGVLTHAFNYGTGAFGGMRGYWNTDQRQLYVFRPLDHFKRLLNSAKLICAEIDYSPDDLVDIALELLRLEGYE